MSGAGARRGGGSGLPLSPRGRGWRGSASRVRGGRARTPASISHRPPLSPNPSPPRGEGSKPADPARLFARFAVLALAAFLIFAHGCHGDGVDDEPQAAPPTADAKPAHR
jgi:hypothetical protein